MKMLKKSISNIRLSFDVPSAQTLYCQKLDFLLNISVADSVGLSSLVFTHLFSKIAVSDARRTGLKTEFNVN